MKSRSLGIIFIAAVILPSILLAVLSIRSAGREEAYVEKQLATTLLAEVIQTAGLANTETSRLALSPFWRRMDWPRRDRMWELWTTRSQMASAIVGSPMASCQLFVGSCVVRIVDDLSYRS